MVPILAAWTAPFPPQTLPPRSPRLNNQFPPQACARDAAPEEDPWPPRAAPPTAATPLLDALLSESTRIRANFFCPGHKQGAIAHASFQTALSQPTGPFALDLPELPALDNLSAPEGVLEETQILAADTFTAGGSSIWDTFFLVNGSTCGVEAAVLAAARPGRKLILPRNAHQSAVHALVLSGAEPVWLAPQYDEELDLLHGVTTAAVAEALEANRGQVDAVLLISPTYHGVCSDVDAIADVAHRHGARLIVDEAHGAHFAFHALLPKSAAHCNADIVVQSTHKTLPALSQAAMMHVRKSAVDRQKIAASLRLVQSTSPNYLLLASLEAARALMDEMGEDLLSRTIDLARNCAVRIASLEGFSVLGVENVGMTDKNSQDDLFIQALDPTRVTVLLPGGGTGYEIDTHLIDRFGVYAELPSFKHITFVFSPGNTKDDVDRLVTSLALYEATSHEGMPDMEMQVNEVASSCSVFGEQTSVTPRAAFFAEAEPVLAEDAIGRICVETLCPYPPGIPVLVAGERVTRECVNVLRTVLDAGGSVSGACDESLSTIRVMTRAEETKVNTR